MTTLAPELGIRELTDDGLLAAYRAADGDDGRSAVLAEARRRDFRAREQRKAAAIRAEWHDAAFADYLTAEAQCKGNLVRRGSPVADGWSLWSGSEAYAMAHASEELRNYWLDHPRLTVTGYQRQVADGRRAYRDDYLQSITERTATDDRMDRDEPGRVRRDARADGEGPQVRGYRARHAVPAPDARAGAQDRAAAGAAAGPGFPVRPRVSAGQVTTTTREGSAMTVTDTATRHAERIAEIRQEVKDRAAQLRAQIAVRPESTVTRQRQEISGEQVLGYAEAFLRRYARFPSQAAMDAMVLWAAHAHARDPEGMLVWDATPRMMLLSAEPGSGKSRALELLGMLCPATFGLDAEPTMAGLVYTLASEHATVLLDEGDLLFGSGKRRAAIRAVLNAGYTRMGTVLRMRGSKGERARVFGPVALAGLDVMKTATGESLAPLFSRSIVIRMRKSADPVPRIDPEGRNAAAMLRSALMTWTTSLRGELADARPEIPGWLANRAEEIWAPLLAVADAAGGDWPERARLACEELTFAADAEDAGDHDVMSELAGLVSGWEE